MKMSNSSSKSSRFPNLLTVEEQKEEAKQVLKDRALELFKEAVPIHVLAGGVRDEAATLRNEGAKLRNIAAAQTCKEAARAHHYAAQLRAEVSLWLKKAVEASNKAAGWLEDVKRIRDRGEAWRWDPVVSQVYAKADPAWNPDLALLEVDVALAYESIFYAHKDGARAYADRAQAYEATAQEYEKWVQLHRVACVFCDMRILGKIRKNLLPQEGMNPWIAKVVQVMDLVLRYLTESSSAAKASS
jgi:hypothetical protein